METTTSGTPKLNAALAKAQAAFEPAEKGSLNPAFKDATQPAKAKGTRYADLTSIVEATRPHLTANGLAVTQEPMECAEGWVKIRTVLLHESGEERASIFSMPCVGKTPQNYGSALTYARRYHYSAVTGAVADDDDGNAASGKEEAPKTRAAPAKPAAPMDPADPVSIEAEAVIAAASRLPDLAAYEAHRPKVDALKPFAAEYKRAVEAMKKRKSELAP